MIIRLLSNKLKILLFALILVISTTGTSTAAVFWLRADTITKAMPDETVVTMWGFAECTANFASCSPATVPGPELTVPAGDNVLTVNLRNNLTGPFVEPVSIIIPGQSGVQTPVWINTSGVVTSIGSRPPGDVTSRVRSLTHETAPAATGVYNWTNVNPGSYIYHSGTHQQVQVQMGLYGVMKKDAAQGEIYPSIPYNKEITLLFSEVDPSLHHAVATDNYGPGKDVTSTIDYNPKYFLINGEPHTAASVPLRDILQGDVNTGETVLFRLINAGLDTHVPVFQGLYVSVVAEDGNVLPSVKNQYSVFLPALKTTDAIAVPSASGNYPIYDRRLSLTNADNSMGGMLAFLSVTNQPFAAASSGFHDFGGLRAGLQSAPAAFTITNMGTADMTLGALSITGNDATDFGIVTGTDNCSGQTIAPAGTCTVQAVYAPTSLTPGSKKAALFIPLVNELPSSNIFLNGCSAAFGDVPAGFWAENSIMSVYCAGVTTGCTQVPLNYCPGDLATRGQMAAFIIRSMVTAGFLDSAFTFGDQPYFTDVPKGHPFFKHVQKMREFGITTGCTPTTFCPTSPVTRGQMAVFIIRALLGDSFTYPLIPYFIDVPSIHPFFRYIQKLRELNITTGFGDGTYRPADTLNRTQLAVFLERAFLQ